MDNEWDTIQPSTSDEDDADAVVVTRPSNFNEPPILAPTNHDALPVFPQPPQDNHPQEPPQETPSPPSSYSSSTTPYEIVEGELPQPPEVRNTLLKASLGILSSWVVRIVYGIRSRIGFWSIASVAAFAGLVVYARRRQRWRRLAEKDEIDKLLLFLNQKDEKIKQLLLQIDRMNETISARRRVPVLRVVVDSPLPRFSRIPT
ncbi:hypothetical protein L1987_61915 [Smallanthus sonchifolius]|uniref:Uncharacterized protein n=1 Tax=Smallanthus sonchifolius TaxID=185202 RepID=A0ACB9C8X7_9ASTR|nr:hypothetical protein L1987_61915 [Smallanthus sonchifolius]